MAGKKKPMISITLIQSPIGRPYRQKDTVRGLGLRKLHQTVIRQDTPQIRGMVSKISHLIEVREVSIHP